jgi:hypothetical protein
MYFCLTSGKSLINEVENISDPLQDAAFSITTDRPIGPVRWWEMTDEPVTNTVVTDRQLETSKNYKSEIHRKNMEQMERDLHLHLHLKLFKGLGILHMLLNAFIG